MIIRSPGEARRILEEARDGLGMSAAGSTRQLLYATG